MITLAAITLHDRLRKDSTEGKLTFPLDYGIVKLLRQGK